MTAPLSQIDAVPESFNPFGSEFRDTINAMVRQIQGIDDLRDELAEVGMRIRQPPMYGAIHAAVIEGWSGVKNVTYDCHAFGYKSFITLSGVTPLNRSLLMLESAPSVQAVDWYPPPTPATARGVIYYHGPSSAWELYMFNEKALMRTGCE